MHADTESHGGERVVRRLEELDLCEQLERHESDLLSVADPVTRRKPRHDHVGVADRLHLVHVELVYCLVKQTETTRGNHVLQR